MYTVTLNEAQEAGTWAVVLFTSLTQASAVSQWHSMSSPLRPIYCIVSFLGHDHIDDILSLYVRHHREGYNLKWSQQHITRQAVPGVGNHFNVLSTNSIAWCASGSLVTLLHNHITNCSSVKIGIAQQLKWNSIQDSNGNNDKVTCNMTLHTNDRMSYCRLREREREMHAVSYGVLTHKHLFNYVKVSEKH